MKVSEMREHRSAWRRSRLKASAKLAGFWGAYAATAVYAGYKMISELEPDTNGILMFAVVETAITSAFMIPSGKFLDEQSDELSYSKRAIKELDKEIAQNSRRRNPYRDFFY